MKPDSVYVKEHGFGLIQKVWGLVGENLFPTTRKIYIYIYFLYNFSSLFLFTYIY